MRTRAQHQTASFQKEKLLRETEKKLQQKKSLRAEAYTDWKSGLLSDEEYRFNKDAYSREITVLQQRADRLSVELGPKIPSPVEFTHWNQLVSQHRKPDNISHELLDAFIEKIEVSEDENGIRLAIKLKFMDEFYTAAKVAQQYQEASA